MPAKEKPKAKAEAKAPAKREKAKVRWQPGQASLSGCERACSGLRDGPPRALRELGWSGDCHETPSARSSRAGFFRGAPLLAFPAREVQKPPPAPRFRPGANADGIVTKVTNQAGAWESPTHVGLPSMAVGRSLAKSGAGAGSGVKGGLSCELRARG